MREEYPRPELAREQWISLNGEWDFEFDFADTLVEKHPLTEKCNNITYHVAQNFSGKIQIPFCPESRLSGIGYKGFVRACWYRKNIRIQRHEHKRWLLNFEAAYHTTHVFINGELVSVHEGGYTPFTVDITERIRERETEIKVHCSGDPRNEKQPSGKQSPKTESYGCYYTRCTGIWQSVWLEEVPEVYLQKLALTPDVDNECLNAELEICGEGKKSIELEPFFDGGSMGKKRYQADGMRLRIFCQLPLKELFLWSPENPQLYELKIWIRSEKGCDCVHSYFGMRKIEVDRLGMKLNGKRIFLRLVLDQGYYPDGVYTAPDDEALKNDIQMAKRLGFHGARLHEKVFERRYLYWADRLGYLVWGEYPNWSFDHTRADSLLYFLPQWLEAVERDYSHPSIIGWCPMNENFDFQGMRQNDTFVKQVYLETKRLDPVRPCIDVSWNFHTMTDFYDVHDYTQGIEEFSRRFAEFEDGKVYDSFDQNYEGQPFFLSEFGGLKWPVDAGGWAYSDDSEIGTEEEFANRLEAFIKILYSNPRICACCYTQLYDVEQERNGFYYYSREEKFGEETVRRISQALTVKAAYENEE